MANKSGRQDLQALRNLIREARAVLPPDLAQGRSKRADELLSAALALTEHLLTVRPAAELGARGGKKTAKRGPEYFAKISGMRKTRAGGRPKKQT
jgi:hypothetical protein